MRTAEIIDSLQFRLFWLKYGVTVLRRSRLSVNKVKIGKKTIRLSVPTGEEKVMGYELRNILYDDCYGLVKIDGPVNSILDVGGNIGLFSLAARSRFPGARIHSYEPNPHVQSHLLCNTSSLSVEVHPEAIGAGDGWIDIESDGGSLFAKTASSDKGTIKKTAIATAIDRLGGSADLLKLDCEGAEWELFEQREIWKRIKWLTMEYHLWANPKMEVPALVRIIRDIGFRITHLSEAPELKWGVLHAARI
jgi:FkbM family methyltransferase